MWHSFITMGGYGWYVWSAYGVTLGVFTLLLHSSLSQWRKVKKHVSACLCTTVRCDE